MNIVTFLGTRPEIIRLSRVIPLLDAHSEHVLVHTGQNFDERLSEVFFRELSIRPPDECLGAKAESFGGQIGQILERGEVLLRRLKPDRVVILGDTNSGLIAIIARRLGIPVYHMEAGNRCFDDRVPEEINRRVIDHCSTILLPYTQRSKDNLLREGIPLERILVTGNPIGEVLHWHADRINASRALSELGVTEKGYFLATVHRAENVDIEPRLAVLMRELETLGQRYQLPVLLSVHPRTRSRLGSLALEPSRKWLRLLEPFGLFDFVRLEKGAFCTLTDSGTVQEECCLLGVPNVTLRDVTERPETIEAGSNILAGADPAAIHRAVELVTSSGISWKAPAEYLVEGVSSIVARVVLGWHFH